MIQASMDEKNGTSKNRFVDSLHGILCTKQRVEDPPNVLFATVMLPEDNGGVGTVPEAREANMKLIDYVRVDVLPQWLQGRVRKAIRKRVGSAVELRLHPRTQYELWL